MYENFYGLREKPFRLTPDPSFLFLSKNHQDVLDHLIYGITQKEGFIAITGEIGTGKTTLCRAVLNQIDENTNTALILNPLQSEAELLKSILHDFGTVSSGTTKNELIKRLNNFLLKQLNRGRHSVVIIDEAQNLSIPVMEQLRILSNIETEKEKLLQIAMVGQTELNKKLRSFKLRQLNQRISIRCHLHPLSRGETYRYIEHRLILAGSHGKIIFSSGVLRGIYRFSRGIPRLINLICDRLLLRGYIEQTYDINKGMLKEALKSVRGEKQTPLVHYLFKRILPYS